MKEVETDPILSEICKSIENFFGMGVAELFDATPHLFKEEDPVIEQALHELFLGFLPNDTLSIKAYDTAYQNALHSFENIVSLEKFMACILQAGTLYLGDHHGITEDKKFLASLIRTMLAQGQQPHLFMECLPTTAQQSINAYLQEQLSSTEFRKAINFRQWGWRWTDYKPVFDVCKQFKIPMHGLHPGYDTNIALHDFDAHAATILRKQQDKQQIVLVGENHVAPTHLPLHVGTTNHVIASNINKALYLQLQEQLTPDDIIQVSPQQYCFRVKTPLDIAIAEVRGHYRRTDERDIYLKGEPTGKGIIQTVRKIYDRVHRQAA